MLYSLVNALFTILYILILANIILSWVRPDPYHPTFGPIIRFIYAVTEPLFAPIRRFLPPMGGLDFSPLIVLLLLRVVQGAVLNLIA